MRWRAAPRMVVRANGGATPDTRSRRPTRHLQNAPRSVRHPLSRLSIASLAPASSSIPVSRPAEIDELHGQGSTRPPADFRPRPRRSPLSRRIDRAQEARLEDSKIGTTLRGIGPAYADKALRHGLRIGDLLDQRRRGSAAFQQLVDRQEPATGSALRRSRRLMPMRSPTTYRTRPNDSARMFAKPNRSSTTRLSQVTAGPGRVRPGRDARYRLRHLSIRDLVLAIRGRRLPGRRNRTDLQWSA